MKEGLGIPVCPEVLGGLAVPRTPAEIVPVGPGGVALARSWRLASDGSSNSSQVAFLGSAELTSAGGMPAIRSVLRGAKVVTADGVDVTRQYIEGAWKALFIGLQSGCSKAILKARSPSCGLGQIYDGTYSGRLVQGHGVFAELLLAHGIEVYTEENFTKLELGKRMPVMMNPTEERR